MKKYRWIFQIAAVLALYILLIFAANKCAAEKDYYSVAGIGLVVSDVPMLFDVSTPTVVTMDDETDIVSIIASPKRVYMYLITDVLTKTSDSEFLGATFAAVDPNHNKYVINMRMYVDKTIQLTICDEDGNAGFSLLLDVPDEHEGVQTKNDIIRQRIIAGL